MTAALLTLFLFPVPNVLSADAQKELKKLQGKWASTTLVKEGVEMTFPPERAPLTVEIKGREWSLVGDALKYEITAIDTTVSPMALTMKCVAPKGRAGHVEEAIFAVADGGLTLMFATPFGPNPVRPAEFTAPKDGGRLLIILTRSKDK